MVKVSTERLPASQVMLQIEVDDERLEKAMASAYRRLAAKTRIPGFRPGKAPPALVQRHLGEHAIFHEALDRLMPEVYREALDQEEIDPIDRAEYELVTEQPLVAKFTIPVRPSVDLGDYASLRVPREPVAVEPERVQEALEGLRHRYATLEPATRPVQWGDLVRAEVHATVDDKALVHEDSAEFQLIEGRSISLPGFVEAIIGHEKGDELEFEVSVPEDAPDDRLRGRQARYQVRIQEVKQEVLPDLDDEFARQAGEGFPSLAALRTRVEEDLRGALEQEAEHRYHDRILDELADRAQIEYPSVLVEREIDRLLHDQVGGAHAELEQYLRRVGKAEEELRAELGPTAQERLRRSLVLSEVAEAEHIEVDDAELEAEVSRMAASAGTQGDEILRLFSGDAAKDSLRRSLVTKRTLERLVEIASGDGAAPEIGQEPAARDD